MSLPITKILSHPWKPLSRLVFSPRLVCNPPTTARNLSLTPFHVVFPLLLIFSAQCMLIYTQCNSLLSLLLTWLLIGQRLHHSTLTTNLTNLLWQLTNTDTENQSHTHLASRQQICSFFHINTLPHIDPTSHKLYTLRFISINPTP